jgi:hypothetical protein
MAWNAVFPTGQTLISQSVTQIQANWQFINTFANLDHYFNSGTGNEGHHKFAQMIVNGADVAPAGVGNNLALYCKNNGAGNPKLYDNTTSAGVKQINDFVYSNIPGQNTFGVATFINATTPNVTSGLIFVSQNGGAPNRAGAYFNWDGATISVSQLFVGGTGNITSIQALQGNPAFITITTTAGVKNWDVIMMNMQV